MDHILLNFTKKNYIVHGVKRRSSSANTERIDHIFDSIDYKNDSLFMHYGDLSDNGSIYRIIYETNPDEIYNLAAQSHVKSHFLFQNIRLTLLDWDA